MIGATPTASSQRRHVIAPVRAFHKSCSPLGGLVAFSCSSFIDLHQRRQIKSPFSLDPPGHLIVRKARQAELPAESAWPQGSQAHGLPETFSNASAYFCGHSAPLQRRLRAGGAFVKTLDSCGANRCGSSGRFRPAPLCPAIRRCRPAGRWLRWAVAPLTASRGWRPAWRRPWPAPAPPVLR